VHRCVDGDLAVGREALALAEIGQHLGVGPPGGAAFGPGVEVARMTAHIDHIVDPGRAAEHLSAQHWDASAVEAEPGLTGIGGVHPVGGGVQLHRRRRYRQR
jgi:hypothetical protein